MELEKQDKIRQIKSFFILNKIFSYVYLNKKLDIMIHNKFLQNKFGYTIEDYKNASKRYKIIDGNGIVKEYLIDSKILIYEGEYLDGKRNGKGKEYYLNGNINKI